MTVDPTPNLRCILLIRYRLRAMMESRLAVGTRTDMYTFQQRRIYHLRIYKCTSKPFYHSTVIIVFTQIIPHKMILTWICLFAAYHINALINVRFIAFNFTARNFVWVGPFTMTEPVNSNINSWKSAQTQFLNYLRLIDGGQSPRRSFSSPIVSVARPFNTCPL